MESRTFFLPVSTGNDQIELNTNYDVSSYSKTQEQSLFLNYFRLIMSVSSCPCNKGIVCVFPSYAFLMYTIHWFLKYDWFDKIVEHKIPFIEDPDEWKMNEMMNVYEQYNEDKKRGKTTKDTIVFCCAFGYYFREEGTCAQTKWKTMDPICRNVAIFIGVPYDTTKATTTMNEEGYERNMVEHIARCIVDSCVVILADYRFMDLLPRLLELNTTKYKNAIEEFQNDWMSYKKISIGQCIFILQQYFNK